MTVDNVGIVWDDLMRSKDSKLIYVALTRAAKQIIFLKN
jgi:ATP-dependent exoDNAse (exonuclease V) beta subunit